MLSRRSLLASAAALPLAAQTSAQKRGPSILLMSGWNLYNIGDVAITPGFLQLAKRHFPDARITMLAASYPKEIGEFLKPKFPDLEIIPMGFHAGKKLTPELQAAFEGADLLVLNSGMTLSYGYYGLEWERYIPRIMAFLKAREMGIPYGVWGHSFDKMEPQADILYRDVFKSASFVYTRDTESLKMLQTNGIRCPEMDFSGDATFGFSLRDTTRGEAFLREHRLEPGKFLAFIPRLDVSRFRSDGQEMNHAEQTRKIIIDYVRATNQPVALVCEVKNELANAKNMVYDLLPAEIKSQVRLQTEYWMPDEAQHVYSKATAVASAEMHSIILGLAAGTPSVHFYFRQAGLKQWMMRDIGTPEWLLDQDEVSPEKIAASLVDIAKNPDAARRKAAKAMEFVRTRQTEKFAVVRRAAETHFRQKKG
jgi:polysaccharide pyruvyl transferase WcaK-like protein